MSVIDTKLIEGASDHLQLLYLYVSRSVRGQGVGKTLFAEAAEAACSLGAKALYISATPTENTVDFYRHLGASVVADPDPDLLAAEPDDVHLTYPLDASRASVRRMSPEPTLSTIPLVSTRHAACSCAQLRLTVEGEPVRVSICHCLACQRRTGSVFGVQARFDAEQVTTEGASRQYIRVSDEGEKRATFHFCPDCGATVFYTTEATPGIVAVPVGAFADPSFPAPTRSVWEERRHSWLRLPDDIEHVS